MLANQIHLLIIFESAIMQASVALHHHTFYVLLSCGLIIHHTSVISMWMDQPFWAYMRSLYQIMHLSLRPFLVIDCSWEVCQWILGSSVITHGKMFHEYMTHFLRIFMGRCLIDVCHLVWDYSWQHILSIHGTCSGITLGNMFHQYIVPFLVLLLGTCFINIWQLFWDYSWEHFRSIHGTCSGITPGNMLYQYMVPVLGLLLKHVPLVYDTCSEITSVTMFHKYMVSVLGLCTGIHSINIWHLFWDYSWEHIPSIQDTCSAFNPIYNI